jgi:hypothetical protein
MPFSVCDEWESKTLSQYHLTTRAHRSPISILFCLHFFGLSEVVAYVTLRTDIWICGLYSGDMNMTQIAHKRTSQGVRIPGCKSRKIALCALLMNAYIQYGTYAGESSSLLTVLLLRVLTSHCLSELNTCQCWECQQSASTIQFHSARLTSSRVFRSVLGSIRP